MLRGKPLMEPDNPKFDGFLAAVKGMPLAPRVQPNVTAELELLKATLRAMK